MKKAIITDIGGTNARLALTDGKVVTDFLKLKSKNYRSLSELVQDYAVKANVVNLPENLVAAVAGKITGDKIKLTNNRIQFSVSKTKKELGLKSLHLLNDLQAHAHSVPTLTDDKLINLTKNKKGKEQRIGVVGIGTGLGVSILIDKKYTVATESGHASSGYVTEEQRKVYEKIKVKNQRLSYEELISGPGLHNIYTAWMKLKNKKPIYKSGKEVFHAALDKDKDGLKAFNLMLEFLGNFLSDLILTANLDCVYLVSKLIDRKISIIKKSKFLDMFYSKGKFADFIKTIPVYAVSENETAMVGLKNFVSNLK